MKVTEFSKQNTADQSAQLNVIALTNLHDQLRQKNDNLLKVDKTIVTLIESEEDLKQEMIEAEEHYSLSTNVS